MSGEAGATAGTGGAQLDVAVRRLERAGVMLEQRLAARQADNRVGDLFDADRARLAADLDACRGRQRDLEEAGEAASRALAAAIAQIRQILAAEGGEDQIPAAEGGEDGGQDGAAGGEAA